jgi:hypothetical protein
MPFVIRTPEGLIASLHLGAPHEGAEALPADHPEVQAFVGSTGGEFGRLDADFVRVIEDVIDTLIARNVINITDLPDQAQAKLFARKSYRERSGRNALRLFGDDSGVADLIDNTQLGDLR